jgi:hypothetical protein
MTTPVYTMFPENSGLLYKANSRSAQCFGIVVDAYESVNVGVNIRPIGKNGVSNSVELRIPADRRVIEELIEALNSTLLELECNAEKRKGQA